MDNSLEFLPVENGNDFDLDIPYKELKSLINQQQLKINIMEQSKFWKIRNHWFEVKRKFGLSA